MTGAEAILGGSLVSWLSMYGYFILIPIMIIEGTTVGFFAGALSSVGVFNPFILFGVYLGVRLIADSVVYFAASSGSEYLKRFDTARNVLDKLRDGDHRSDLAEFIDAHFFESLFLAKVLPVPTLDTALLIAAGAMDIAPKRVYSAILSGQSIWSAMIIGLGYFFGDTLANPERIFNVIGFTIGAIIVFVVLYNKYGHNWFIEKTRLGQLLKR